MRSYGGVTLDRMAHYVGVSTRTIRRDLDALQEVHVPIMDSTLFEDHQRRWRLIKDAPCPLCGHAPAETAAQRQRNAASAASLSAVLLAMLFVSGCGNTPLAPAPSVPLQASLGVASPDGTRVPGASQIVDSHLATWTLGPQGEVLQNGQQVVSPDLGGSMWKGYANALKYEHATVSALGKDDGQWWAWDGTRFVMDRLVVSGHAIQRVE